MPVTATLPRLELLATDEELAARDHAAVPCGVCERPRRAHAGGRIDSACEWRGEAGWTDRDEHLGLLAPGLSR